MDAELDLRVYLDRLRRHWVWLAALGLLAGAAAGLISLFLPPVYEASALVSVASPRFSLRFEGVTEAAELPVQAYHELAQSDAVVDEVFGRIRPELPAEVNTLSAFAAQLDLETASDVTLLRLKVRDGDPARAAAIANLWAEVFTDLAGQLYGQDAASVAVYEQALADAKATLDRADAALTEFQATNQKNILEAQLDSQSLALEDFLSRQHEVELLLEDAGGLQTRLEQLDGTAPAGQAEEVALISIASLLYGGRLASTETENGQTMTPLQFQLTPGQGATGATVADQRGLAADLLASLAVRRDYFASAIAALEPGILALQGELAAAEQIATDLERSQFLAEDQYTKLAAKVLEAAIAVQESTGIAQIASPAFVPSERASPRPVLNTLLGAAIGVVLGALVALSADGWRNKTPLAQSTGKDTGRLAVDATPETRRPAA